jgi:transposase
VDLLSVERVDHLGLVAGVIKDLGLTQAIDARIGRHDDEKISCGEAVAGMIMNGLGFSDRPLTLAPQFFDNAPTALLLGPHAEPAHFNRFKLGRALDDVHDYGCDLLFSELAMAACKKEGIETRFRHLDSSSFSLNGEYLPDADVEAVTITHGHSKDHRPDLKQVVLELMASQDGRIPLISKSWDGNTSDNEIFRERAKAIVDEFKNGADKHYLIADSKLYSQSNAKNLLELPFITRIPESINLVQDYINRALTEDSSWEIISESRKIKVFEVEHYEIKQRWCVVYSKGANERSKVSITRNISKEKADIDKELFHLAAQRFSCEPDARKELEKLSKKWKSFTPKDIEVITVNKHQGRGRPKTTTQPNEVLYKINATVKEIEAVSDRRIERSSCYVVGTNIPETELTSKEIVENYSGQDAVERGFRFLKDPVFFVSSLFVKKPSRVEGLLMVMTLSLLVYSIAERRLRKKLLETETTIPNQINKETATPTLRWVFQLLTGVNRVKVSINGVESYIWHGLTELRRKILSLLGDTVMEIYGINQT